MKFELCETCRNILNNLSYLDGAEKLFSYLPSATFYWEDEFPKGNPLIHTGVCSRTALNLIAVRRKVWMNVELSQESKEFWAHATEQIPYWPGFRRLELCEKEMQEVQSFQVDAANFLDTLHTLSAHPEV